jgi:UDP:flavonoid glycosyltransferase YjiC (YdhE family)
LTEIACFVSPHGFGHATRAIAVVDAVQRIRADVHAHFLTTVPKPLFAQTLTDFTYHQLMVDVGLVQSTAMDSDIPATIRRLDGLQPFNSLLLEDLARLCAKCSLILCDIAPLGIAVARRAGLPSILVENFTWDWIYQPYVSRYPALVPHVEFLSRLFARADYRVQTEPLCWPAPRDLHCGPIFRRMTENRTNLRQRLGVGDRKLVLITMGGIFQRVPAALALADFPGLYFLFAGQEETRQLTTNSALLARDSGHYLPDLTSVADVVVCKAGYSTVAECCQAGARVISVGRAGFPETEPLQDYLEKRLGAIAITPEMYQNGSWLPLAADLLGKPKPLPAAENGADKVTALLCSLL